MFRILYPDVAGAFNVLGYSVADSITWTHRFQTPQLVGNGGETFLAMLCSTQRSFVVSDVVCSLRMAPATAAK